MEEYDVESILDMYEDSYVPEPRAMMSNGGLLEEYYGKSQLAYQQAVKDGFQGTYEEYLRFMSPTKSFADGGRIPFDSGQLVKPSVDGSRPGYAKKDKTKTLKKMDIPGRSATGETIDLKTVQELVTKANQGNKYITAEDIAAQYYKNKKIGKEYIREYEGKKAKKFPRLWGSPAVNEILKTLDPKELKVQKVLEDMLADENPFTTGKLKNTNKKLSDLQFSKMAPWKQYISNETGLAYKGIENSLNSKNFMDGWYKNNRDTLISFGQIKKDLEGLSFSEQLKYATDVKGNKPVYTRIEKTKNPVFDVMDYALRSWNNTKGKGPIQFFDKNGDPIKWQTNKKLPYSQVSFKYDGNTYSVGGSNNTISLRKNGNTFFPEVYEQNSFKNKLYDTLVDNPFKPGKEIPFGKLMNLIQNKGYGWKKGTGVLDILHGPNGVALEPFTNLSFGTRDLNLTLSQIDKIPITGLKNKYINILTKDFKGKSGEELIKAIINQQTNLASKIAAGEKFIIPTRTQLFLDTLDPDKRIIGDVGKNTEKYIKQKIYEQTRPSSKLKPDVVSEIKKQYEILENLQNLVSKGGSKGKAAAKALQIIAAGGLGFSMEDILKGTGLIDKEYEQTASAADAPIVEKGLSTGEKIAAGTATAGTLGTKVGRKALGKALNLGFGPTGILGINAYLGIDPKESLDRAMLGVEGALLPSAVKGTLSVTDKIKNPFIKKAVERATLAGMSPTMALRFARVANPIGIATLAGEGLYQLGKKGYDQYQAMQDMTEQEKSDFLADQYESLGGVFGEGA